MRKRSMLGVAVLLALGTGGPSATAGPASSAAPVASARKDVKEAREDLREARKDGGPAAVASAMENLKKAQDKLHDTRVERRKNHVDELKTKWKDVIERQDAKEAIRIHARREARLHRMKAIATELGKTALITRIDALIAKEQTRFEKKMGDIKEAKK